MPPLAARQFGICGAHGLELGLDAMARYADRRDALALAQIGDGFRDFLDKVCATAVGRGAEVHQRVAAEGLLDDFLRNRANVVVLGPVTTRLHDRHGSVAPAEVPDVIDPIAERLIAENHHVAFVLCAALEVVRPDQGEYGVVAHEESMRAVINVLAAEIPHLQCDLILARAQQSRGDDRDAVGGIAVGLKR
jgi:hypothetical protein